MAQSPESEKELTLTVERESEVSGKFKAEIYRLPPTGEYGDRPREVKKGEKVLCHCNGTCEQVRACLAHTLQIINTPPESFFTGSQGDGTRFRMETYQTCAEHYLRCGQKG